MASPILVTGAAGRVGALRRAVTEMLLKQGKTVRAMVRNEDERAQALRDMGAAVVVGDLLDIESMHGIIAGGPGDGRRVRGRSDPGVGLGNDDPGGIPRLAAFQRPAASRWFCCLTDPAGTQPLNSFGKVLGRLSKPSGL